MPRGKVGRPVSLPKYQATMQLVKAGLGNAEIAAQVGVHRNTVLRYRTGRIVAPTVAPPVPPAPWPTRRHRYRPPEDVEGLDRWADDGGRLEPPPKKRGPKYIRPTAGLFGREKYQAMRALNLCAKCEQAPPLAGKTRCAPCLLYVLILSYKKAFRRLRGDQCVQCGRAAGPGGGWRCTACLRARRGREAGAQAPSPPSPSTLFSLDPLFRRVAQLGNLLEACNVPAIRRVLQALDALIVERDRALAGAAPYPSTP